MARTISRETLEAACCWEADDRVPRDAAMTEFRRSLRYHQAKWREARGLPIGRQPIAARPGGRVRPVGSRLDLDHARATGANFVTPAALHAATRRAASPEPHQTFDHQRLWADLLSSLALACNLFGDLAADHDLATRAVRTWWPHVPGTVVDVRFAHSPGRLDASYLNNLRVFDAMIVLDLGDGSHGALAIDVKYHEWAKPETPRPENERRYVEVAERSKMLRAGAVDGLRGRSDLAETWLEHMLVHAMLQHPTEQWTWASYVVVHPAGNTSIAGACERYADMLADQSTFATMTLEALLDAGALPAPTAAVLADRYVSS